MGAARVIRALMKAGRKAATRVADPEADRIASRELKDMMSNVKPRDETIFRKRLAELFEDAHSRNPNVDTVMFLNRWRSGEEEAVARELQQSFGKEHADRIIGNFRKWSKDVPESVPFEQQYKDTGDTPLPINHRNKPKDRGEVARTLRRALQESATKQFPDDIQRIVEELKVAVAEGQLKKPPKVGWRRWATRLMKKEYKAEIKAEKEANKIAEKMFKLEGAPNTEIVTAPIPISINKPKKK